MTPAALRAALSQPSRILVVGDLMLDAYIQGDAQRISPEAPVPVVRVRDRRHVAGGAGNVAMSLAGLGAEVTLVATVGEDSAATTLGGLLGGGGIRFQPIQVDRPTTLKTRIVSDRQQMMRIDEEESSSLETGEEARVTANLGQLDWSTFDAVLISDYHKGFCTSTICARVLEHARASGVRVFVDPKGVDWERYRGAWLVSPNLAELNAICGSAVPNLDAAVGVAAAEVRSRFDLAHLLVTRSSQGMTLSGEHETVHVPTLAREVFDVSGAGDTVIATLCRLCAAGATLTESLPVANCAAGIAIAHAGTYPVQTTELLAEYRPETRAGSSKLCTLEEVVSLANAARAEGRQVVFTNGVFDILHAGHVSYLEQAAALGDMLILGLNSDASTRRLKGPSRPVNSEEARAAVLSGLEAVDHIVLFDADTPIDLIRTLRPDTLVKGGDYRPEDIVGREYAGRTQVLPYLEGHSTTAIIATARNGADT